MRRADRFALKPFVYLAAIGDPQVGLTPASLLADEPLVRDSVLGGWAPQNHDLRFRGPVTVRTALEQSLNVPVVRVAEALGIERLGRFGESLALGRGGLPRVPSIALGTFDAALLDVVASYTVFPGGGEQVAPRFVDGVSAPSGVSLLRAARSASRVADPAPVYVVHDMLEGVVARGTARGARAAGLRLPVAGKTGTTDDYRDAWFVGYSPAIVLGVWVGYDDDRPLGAAAAEIALPVWTEIMKRGFAGAPPVELPAPPGVELVKIDAATGRRAQARCGPSLTQAFVRGTAPADSCVARARVGPGEASVLRGRPVALREEWPVGASEGGQNP